MKKRIIAICIYSFLFVVLAQEVKAQVFWGGNGIVYAITQQGDLLWYYYPDYLKGSNKYEMKVIGSGGWSPFIKVY